MKKVNGGITAVQGFSASGIHCGIKPKKLPDLALIYSDVPSTAAGVFTANQFQAPPLKVTQRHLLKKHQLQAVIINSGNANAFTGAKGLRDAKAMTAMTARSLNLKNELVAVASTGIISASLPMEKILEKISEANRKLSSKGSHKAAQAMMTTDTRIKEAAYQAKIKNKVITIGGIAKGSGMIHPNMATLLCFLSTDIRIPHKILQKALHRAVEASFNSISVDGCMSTNDMVLCMANGKTPLGPIQSSSPVFKKFSALLQKVCTDLAKQIARDGEGATKFVEIRVQGAPTPQWAKKIGIAVALSPLVKTALFGEDANWGRIVAAIGSCGLKISEKQVDISFGDQPFIKQGTLNPRILGKKIKQYLKRKDILITLDLHAGAKKWIIWTCDFSYDYVKINASYRT